MSMGGHVAVLTYLLKKHFLVFLQDGGAVVGPIFPKPLAQLLAATMAARGRPATHRLKSHSLGAAAAALVEGHLRDGHQLLLWSAAWAEVPTSPHVSLRARAATLCPASCSGAWDACPCMRAPFPCQLDSERHGRGAVTTGPYMHGIGTTLAFGTKKTSVADPCSNL